MTNSPDYVKRLTAVLAAYPHDQYEAVVDCLDDAWTRDATLYVMGNGGSSATASHMVADFTNLVAWPCIALTDNVPTLTATANDHAYEDVFARYLQVMLRKEDVVIAFSGSGNSPNILAGLRYARPLCDTIAITGMGGGKAAGIADTALVIPSDDMQLIEDCHLVTVHMLTQHFRK